MLHRSCHHLPTLQHHRHMLGLQTHSLHLANWFSLNLRKISPQQLLPKRISPRFATLRYRAFRARTHDRLQLYRPEENQQHSQHLETPHRKRQRRSCRRPHPLYPARQRRPPRCKHQHRKFRQWFQNHLGLRLHRCHKPSLRQRLQSQHPAKEFAWLSHHAHYRYQ